MRRHTTHGHLPALLIAIALLATACGSLRDYDKATRYFSQGATAEMKARGAEADDTPTLAELYPPAADQAATQGAPRGFYEAALRHADKALSRPSTLERNQVLGNALVVKALSEWKLNRPQAAEQTAAKALPVLRSAPRNEKSDRDEALALAIPGLVALDVVYDSLRRQAEQIDARTAQLDTNPDTTASRAVLTAAQAAYQQFVHGQPPGGYSTRMALEVLGAAMPVAQRNREAAQYLLMAQLAGLKVWYDAYAKTSNFSRLARLTLADPAVVDWNRAERSRYLTERDRLMTELKTLLGSDTHALYKYWDALL